MMNEAPQNESKRKTNLLFQVGLSEPHRLGHAEEVRLRLLGPAPVQTDGEPWIQRTPAEICVKHHKQVDVLRVVR